MLFAKIIPALGVLLVLGCATMATGTDHDDFFEREVRPILVEKCLSCHGANKQEGKLRLDSRDAVLRGGEGGPACCRAKLGGIDFAQRRRTEDSYGRRR